MFYSGIQPNTSNKTETLLVALSAMKPLDSRQRDDEPKALDSRQKHAGITHLKARGLNKCTAIAFVALQLRDLPTRVTASHNKMIQK